MGVAQCWFCHKAVTEADGIGIPLWAHRTCFANRPGRPRRPVGDKRELLDLAEQLDNVAAACRYMGVSRDSFYRWSVQYEEFGKAGLRPASRRGDRPERRVSDYVEATVLAFAKIKPEWGKRQVATRLNHRIGWAVSATGVRCVWVRHGLTTRKLRELRGPKLKVRRHAIETAEAIVENAYELRSTSRGWRPPAT